MTTKTTGTIKGFIFDLDGVIVFTDKLHYQAWKRMADRLGIAFDETVNNRLRGVSGRSPWTLSWKMLTAQRWTLRKSGVWRRRKTPTTGSCWRNSPRTRWRRR